MKELFRAGALAAILVAFAASNTAQAGGDLAFIEEPEPQSSGCYLRSDVGVAFGTTAEAEYRVGSSTDVADEDFDTGYFFESGYGCSFTRRLRAELVAGYNAEREFTGDGLNPGIDISGVSHYTLMANFYWDLGKFRRFRPYIGAGVGFSYNIMDEWYQQGTTSRAPGDEDLAFAWSLMAGFGYQLTPRTTFDLGYRYMNFGDVSSERVDSTNSPNPPFYINDMGTHQIKAGLRYQLGPVQYETAETPFK